MSSEQFDITRDAVLVRLSINRFGGQMRSAELSKEIAKAHKADEEAIRTVITLLKPEDRSGVNTLRSRARTIWRAMTVPWGDDGQRLCPVTNYEALMKALRGFKDEFDDLVSTRIVKRWDELVRDAKSRLHGLADNYRWPSKEEIAEYYAMHIDTDVVPASKDIRLRHVNADVVAGIKENREGRVQGLLEKTKDDVADRLAELLEDLVDRCTRKDEKTGDDAVFRDSVITNIREQLKVLPKLNVLNDEALSKAMERMQDKIANVEPDDMRENKETKAAVVKESNAILGDLRGFKSKKGTK